MTARASVLRKEEWIKLHAYLRWHDREIKIGCKPKCEYERIRLEKLDWFLAELDWELKDESI